MMMGAVRLFCEVCEWTGVARQPPMPNGMPYRAHDVTFQCPNCRHFFRIPVCFVMVVSTN